MIVDAHCDALLSALRTGRSMSLCSGTGQADFIRMRAGGVKVVFLALFADPSRGKAGSLARCLRLLDLLWQETDVQQGTVPLVENYTDLNLNNEVRGPAVVLSIEGGEALEGELSNLRVFHRLGVRSLTLTWNLRNDLADGVSEKDSDRGLTQFGREVVQEMNCMGMIIDLAHISPRGFSEGLELATSPVIVSHANCWTLCNHPRNLSDRQIIDLANHGGVLGITFAPQFLTENGKASLADVINHIEYAVELVGEDYVGLGSDFDGIETAPVGLEDATCFNRLAEELTRHGFGSEACKKILGGNFIRVLQTIDK